MNYLSDNTFIILVQRCTLFERITKKNLDKSYRLRRWLSLVKTGEFINKYKNITSMAVSHRNESNVSIACLKSLPKGFLDGLCNLRILHIPYDKVTCWCEFAGSCSNLQTLDMDRYIPEAACFDLLPKSLTWFESNTSSVYAASECLPNLTASSVLSDSTTDLYLRRTDASIVSTTLLSLLIVSQEGQVWNISANCPNLTSLTVRNYILEPQQLSALCQNLPSLTTIVVTVATIPECIRILRQSRVKSLTLIDAKYSSSMRIILSSSLPPTLERLELVSNDTLHFDNTSPNLFDLSITGYSGTLPKTVRELSLQVADNDLSTTLLTSLSISSVKKLILPESLTSVTLNVDIPTTSRSLPDRLPARLRHLSIYSIYSGIRIPEQWDLSGLDSINVPAILPMKQLEQFKGSRIHTRNSSVELRYYMTSIGKQRHYRID